MALCARPGSWRTCRGAHGSARQDAAAPRCRGTNLPLGDPAGCIHRALAAPELAEEVAAALLAAQLQLPAELPRWGPVEHSPMLRDLLQERDQLQSHREQELQHLVREWGLIQCQRLLRRRLTAEA